MSSAVREFNDKMQAAFDNAVRNGAAAPACFQCAASGDKTPATHVSRTITPAGHRAWACATHAERANQNARRPLFGSDPGWRAEFVTVESLRQPQPPSLRDRLAAFKARTV